MNDKHPVSSSIGIRESSSTNDMSLAYHDQPETQTQQQYEMRHANRNDKISLAINSLPLLSDEVLIGSGLNAGEVQQRKELKLTNEVPNDSSRSVWQILRANLFTLFNGILGLCLLVVLLVGQWQDALFGFIVIVNTLIGVVQEYRAKYILDKLAVLNAPIARVRRNNAESEINVAEVVYDDLLVLRTGDQIPADGRVLKVEGLSVDESLLTGESEPISKNPGDEVLSGSVVVSGSGYIRVNRIGTESFASKLTAEAKRFSLVNSEIRNSLNKIILYITYAIVPVVLLILNGQMKAFGGWGHALETGQWRKAVIYSVASVVGMVPEGLVLIASVSFGLAAVELARRKVLVQELPAVEGLARVNIVCLDKTGTLTEGEIAFDQTDRLLPEDQMPQGWQKALAWLGADPNANATARTLAERYRNLPTARAKEAVPFSSARKWSAVSFDEQEAKGTWLFGAPEMVLSEALDDARGKKAADVSSRYAREGLRALVFYHSPDILSSDDARGELPPTNLTPIAIVTFREKLRSDAKATLDYFREQDVKLRVISGDNPNTVAAVAQQVGIDDNGYDARMLPEDIDELGDVLEKNEVFGRVTPEQKKNIVLALQKRGHTVAMTGDGVNDALALKNADIGIAMGSGAPATKAVARLVLLDGKFSRMPGVVAEGRRVIANIERVSNLFLSKTTYSIVIALFIAIGSAFVSWSGHDVQLVFPFRPRQLSIVSALTIGIPSFFLALFPNKRRYFPGFLTRVLIFSIPAGIVASVGSLSTYFTAHAYGLLRAISDEEHGDAARYADLPPAEQELIMGQTASLITLLMIAFWILSVLCRPLDKWRVAVLGAVSLCLLSVLTLPVTQDFFLVHLPEGQYRSLLWTAIAIGAAGCIAIEIIYQRLQAAGAIAVKAEVTDR